MKLFISLKGGGLVEIELKPEISLNDLHKILMGLDNKMILITDVNNNRFYIRHKEVQYYFLEINNENI